MTNIHKRFALEAVPPLRIASWNLENYGDKRDKHAEKTRRLAEAIVHKLGSPHILAVQEMCDDSGQADDGVTSAAQNGQDLADAVRAIGGPEYRYVEVPPLDKMDGGKPGSNIRCGYFYRPDRVRLTPPAEPTAGVRAATLADTPKGPCLQHANPAVLAEDSPAFAESRKPLVGQFEDLKTHEQYFLTNLHLASDGGFRRFRQANPGVNTDSYPAQQQQQGQPPSSSPQQQVAQAPQFGIGQPIAFQPNQERREQRIEQMLHVTNFTAEVSERIARSGGDSARNHVVILGDFNTPTHVMRNGMSEPSIQKEIFTILRESGYVDLGAGLAPDNCSHRHDDLQMTLDYIYSTPELAARMGSVTRPMVNDGTQLTRVSDHNPTIISITAPHRLVTRAMPHSFR